jgi:long-chain fatty acid transport protein
MRCLLPGCISVCVFLASGQANSGNGLNLIGFGIESNLLAGADVAMAHDTGALNTNPAGLSHTKHQVLDFHFGVGYPSDMRHRDQFGNDIGADNPLIPLANLAFARRMSNDSKLTIGIGSFAQGGSGNRYKAVNTVFGTSDEMSSRFIVGKLVPGMAYQMNDKLSLGIALPLAVADFRQKLFPQTSVLNPGNPAQSFFGTKLNKARGTAIGLRMGAQYRPRDDLTLGITYSSKSKIDLENGEVRANLAALGLGEVKYRDATVKGLALPQEVGLGLAWRVNDPWQVSLKLAWLDWSDALESNTLTATKPDNPAAPPTISNTTSLDWRDQYVVALGLAYRWDERTTLMGGYNHGRNPIPSRTINPLLNAFGENHLTFGAVRRVNDEWQLAAALEYNFKTTVKSNNPELPFGPDARETGELLALHLGVSRRW